MAVVNQIRSFLSSVSYATNLGLLAAHAQQIGVNAEVDLLLVSDTGEVEVVADLVSSLYTIHCRHDCR